MESLPTKTIMVVHNDFVDIFKNTLFNLEESGGKFHAKFDMTHRHDVTLMLNDFSWDAIAQPGDSIYVVIDAEKHTIQFSGANSKFNNELAQLTAINFYDTIGLDLNSDDKGILAQLNDKFKTIEEGFAKRAAEMSISPEVRDYATRNYLYMLGLKTLSYRLDDGAYSAERYDIRSDKFFDLYNPKNAEHSLFVQYIRGIYDDFRNDDKKLKAEIEKSPEEWDKAKIQRLYLDHVLDLPKSHMRDILIVSGLTQMSLQFAAQPIRFDKRYLNERIYHDTRFMERYARPIVEI